MTGTYFYTMMLNQKLKFNFTGKIILSLAILAMTCSFALHKFYVSKSTIELNPRTGTYEVTCKFFTDDLENAVKAESNQHVDFAGSDATRNSNELLEAYVSKHFKVWFDDQPIPLIYVGYEEQDDMIYCYCEFFKAQDFHTVKIENTCLISQFQDQQNIVDLKVNSTTSTVILTKDKPVDVIYR